MSSLFGVCFRRGRPSGSRSVQSVLRQLAACGTGEGVLWHDDYCGLGQRGRPSPSHEQGASTIDLGRNVAFACAARLDNSKEVGSALGLSFADLAIKSDGDIVKLAYAAWGERCTERLYGDWSFAAWHPAERRLFLARDHFGITAVYYHADEDVLVLSSSLQDLLALKLAPVELDELYLAQVVTSWSAYNGERTIYSPIRRLEPAHRLTVTPDRMTKQEYWSPTKTPELFLPKREDYVESFREVFDDAVRSRLRTANASDGIASTLSGGLDSSSVTVTAASALAEKGRRVAAYTAVPIFETSSYVNRAVGDERLLASATARFSGAVDLNMIHAAESTPLQGIRKALKINKEPLFGAANLFWILDLWKAAQAAGNKVLLLGQFGNGGISWTGDVFSQSLLFQLRHMGWRNWAREKLKRTLPPALLTAWRRHRANPELQYRASAINPAFAGRLNLFERRLNDPDQQPPRTALDLRSFLQPGRSATGALHAGLGAAFGLEVRDPTADARVLSFAFSVPDHIFIDPKTGMNRWLIREAMKGRLPDEVRLNRKFGRQAADLVPRLRASAAEVETALNELSCGRSAGYVDVPYMREVWQMIQTQDTPEALHKSMTILTRGIMAGLFVNDFGS